MTMLETVPDAATSCQELDKEVNNAYSVIQKENYHRSASYQNRFNSRGRGRGGGRGGGSLSHKRSKPDSDTPDTVQEN